MSKVMNEVINGQTRDVDGVPLGLINYMIAMRDRHGPRRHVRIGDRVGELHFRSMLRVAREVMLVWTDAHDGKVELS